LKCTRGHFKSVRLAGIALGCGIALDIGASAAAGAPASANARVPATLNVGCGRNGTTIAVYFPTPEFVQPRAWGGVSGPGKLRQQLCEE
jgi:hypothetical protein